ncbi:kelch-like protein 17 isoform X2 [Bactrocera dorsalis]|uniref:Kelch-like protein diablo n=1 Tax=Bactrocera dorsalis TaxID=27457 RepID=A0ABM3K981_BACDO|nr:kelch-like protein 17 isoform X2 [Bactrocera dorsalis]
MATIFTPGPALQSNSSEQNRFMEKLMAKILSFYDEQSLIDVTFKVSNPTAVVPAHRLILAAASPYFENLFKGEQGNNPVIEINDIDSDTFERLITFCYTGKAFITVNNVGAMLKAALILQLDDVTSSCVDFLITNINDYTLQAAYTLERETQCERLKQKLIEYEIKNFMEISRGVEFLSFDVEKLQRILESDNLHITREEDAYDAIKRWFNYDVPARQEALPLLMSCLRLTQFDVDFLLTHIQPLPGCELLVFKALTWIGESAVRTKLNMRFTEPRATCEKTFLAIFRVGFYHKLLQYNKAEDKWREYENLEIDYFDYGTILKDENILFIGGYKSGDVSNIVRSLNIRNKTWQNLCAMKQARCGHSVVEIDGKIFAIGGYERGLEGGKVLPSVERYTPSDGWESVSSLIVERHSAGAVTLNNKIYIMGGTNTPLRALKLVECYNPDSNIWTSCADMMECRVLPHVKVHKGHIYVLDTYSANRRQSVERYDPERNTWSKICCLNSDWARIAGMSLDNKLWLFGRLESDNVPSVSVYDEHNDRWVEKCSLHNVDGLFRCIVPVALVSMK